MQENVLRSQTYPPKPSLSESDSTLSLDSSVDGSDYRSWCGGAYVYLDPFESHLPEPFFYMASVGKTYRSGSKMIDWSLSSLVFFNDFRCSESRIYYINDNSQYRFYGSVGLGAVCGGGLDIFHDGGWYGFPYSDVALRAGVYVPAHFGLESESFIFDLEIGPEVTGIVLLKEINDPSVAIYIISGFKAGFRF